MGWLMGRAPDKAQDIARGLRALAQSYDAAGMPRAAARAEREADRMMRRVPAWVLAIGRIVIMAVLFAAGIAALLWGFWRLTG
jgi:hypothetical protein